MLLPSKFYGKAAQSQSRSSSRGGPSPPPTTSSLTYHQPQSLHSYLNNSNHSATSHAASAHQPGGAAHGATYGRVPSTSTASMRSLRDDLIAATRAVEEEHQRGFATGGGSSASRRPVARVPSGMIQSTTTITSSTRSLTKSTALFSTDNSPVRPSSSTVISRPTSPVVSHIPPTYGLFGSDGTTPKRSTGNAQEKKEKHDLVPSRTLGDAGSRSPSHSDSGSPNQLLSSRLEPPTATPLMAAPIAMQRPYSPTRTVTPSGINATSLAVTTGSQVSPVGSRKPISLANYVQKSFPLGNQPLPSATIVPISLIRGPPHRLPLGESPPSGNAQPQKDHLTSETQPAITQVPQAEAEEDEATVPPYDEADGTERPYNSSSRDRQAADIKDFDESEEDRRAAAQAKIVDRHAEPLNIDVKAAATTIPTMSTGNTNEPTLNPVAPASGPSALQVFSLLDGAFGYSVTYSDEQTEHLMQWLSSDEGGEFVLVDPEELLGNVPQHAFAGQEPDQGSSSIRGVEVTAFKECVDYLAYHLDFGPTTWFQAFRLGGLLRRAKEYGDAKRRSSKRNGGPATEAAALVLLRCYGDMERYTNLVATMAVLSVQQGIITSADHLRKHFPYEEVLSRCLYFHDASPFDDVASVFDLTVEDVVRGAVKAISLWGSSVLCDEMSFIEPSEMFAQLKNGDVSWIIPGETAACSCPVPDVIEERDGREGQPAAFYGALFGGSAEESFFGGVGAVVQLNAEPYNHKALEAAGVVHINLAYEDGSIPSNDIVDIFLSILEEQRSNQKGVVVHCMAGLGRTGTLLCLDLMVNFCFSAREAIGWCRLLRPGMVIGHQQQFLLWYEGALRRMKHSKSGDPKQSQVKRPAKIDIDKAAASLADLEAHAHGAVGFGPHNKGLTPEVTTKMIMNRKAEAGHHGGDSERDTTPTTNVESTVEAQVLQPVIVAEDNAVYSIDGSAPVTREEPKVSATVPTGTSSQEPIPAVPQPRPNAVLTSFIAKDTIKGQPIPIDNSEALSNSLRDSAIQSYLDIESSTASLLASIRSRADRLGAPTATAATPALVANLTTPQAAVTPEPNLELVDINPSTEQVSAKGASGPRGTQTVPPSAAPLPTPTSTRGAIMRGLIKEGERPPPATANQLEIDESVNADQSQRRSMSRYSDTFIPAIRQEESPELYDMGGTVAGYGDGTLHESKMRSPPRGPRSGSTSQPFNIDAGQSNPTYAASYVSGVGGSSPITTWTKKAPLRSEASQDPRQQTSISPQPDLRDSLHGNYRFNPEYGQQNFDADQQRHTYRAGVSTHQAIQPDLRHPATYSNPAQVLYRAIDYPVAAPQQPPPSFVPTKAYYVTQDGKGELSTSPRRNYRDQVASSAPLLATATLVHTPMVAKELNYSVTDHSVVGHAYPPPPPRPPPPTRPPSPIRQLVPPPPSTPPPPSSSPSYYSMPYQSRLMLRDESSGHGSRRLHVHLTLDDE